MTPGANSGLRPGAAGPASRWRSLLGGAIGLERELKGKPAGLRTNILICIGATLFTSLSVHAGAGPRRSRPPGRPDPDRRRLHRRGHHPPHPRRGHRPHQRGHHLGGDRHRHRRWARGPTSRRWAPRSWSCWCSRAWAGSRTSWPASPRTTRLIVHAVRIRPPSRSSRPWCAAPAWRSWTPPSRQENVDLVVELKLQGFKRLHEEAMIAILHHPLVRTVSRGE